MTSSVTVRFWAGARRAAGRDSDVLTAATLADLVEQLASEPGLARICEASAFLVDGLAASPGTALPDGATVDVLPPFAGG